MTTDPNSVPRSITPETMSHDELPPDLVNDISQSDPATTGMATQNLAKMPQGGSSKTPETSHAASRDFALAQAITVTQRATINNTTAKPSVSWTILAAIAVIFLGLALDNLLLGLLGTILALLLSLAVLWLWLQTVMVELAITKQALTQALLLKILTSPVSSDSPSQCVTIAVLGVGRKRERQFPVVAKKFQIY